MRMIPVLRACYVGSRCAKPGNATCRVASEQGDRPAVSERRRLAKAARASAGQLTYDWMYPTGEKVNSQIDLVSSSLDASARDLRKTIAGIALEE
jgi:hypothetical protein